MERLEIIDSGRRRRFSKEMKLQIVAESYSEPGLCATTARRHGIRVRSYMNGAGSHERGNWMLRRMSAPLSRRCLLQR